MALIKNWQHNVNKPWDFCFGFKILNKLCKKQTNSTTRFAANCQISTDTMNKLTTVKHRSWLVAFNSVHNI